MDRLHTQRADGLDSEAPRKLVSRWLTGALAGAGLIGTVWSLAGTAVGGARTANRPAIRLAGASVAAVRYDDMTRMLADPDPAVRLDAIKYLEVLDRPAEQTITTLSRLFDDPDPVVRIQAVYAAIRLGMPAERGMSIASRLVIPRNPRVCCLASQILGLAGEPARGSLPKLRGCLTASATWVPLHAARAIVRIEPHDRDAVAVLRRAWEQSPSGEVREFTERALEEAAGNLAHELEDGELTVRRAAATSLEQFRTCGTSAVPALLASLNDSDLMVRVHAARAAFRAGVPASRIVGPVSDLLIPEEPDVLRQSTLLLVEIGPEAQAALPQLHACLTSPAPLIRLHAAEAALRIDSRDASAIAALQAAVMSPRADIRYFAVNSLGPAVLESERIAFALMWATGDESPQVSVAAALQLSRALDISREQQALTLMADAGLEPAAEAAGTWAEDLSSDADDLRREAALRLALAGPAAGEALPALLGALKDSDPAQRLAVSQAIWEVGRDATDVLPVLVDLLSSDRCELRIGAAFVLGQMGDAAAEAVPVLTRNLRKSNQVFERLLLAASLVRITPQHDPAFRLLLEGLGSENADIRYLSTVALGAMPQSRQLTTEEALGAVIQDGNARVRHAAYESLSQMLVRRTVLPAAAADVTMLQPHEYE